MGGVEKCPKCGREMVKSSAENLGIALDALGLSRRSLRICQQIGLSLITVEAVATWSSIRSWREASKISPDLPIA